MTGRRIVIVSPRTWGQFGNFLAATRFAGVLRSRFPDDEVTVWEAEATMPWIGDIGGRIADITVSSPDPATRAARYVELMAELEREHPAGFEVHGGSGIRAKVAALRASLEREDADLVIGTKGFVARLCKAALRDSGRDTPVVSYVTNPGLLDLGIHRSAHLDAVLVPFDWAKDQLLSAVGGDPRAVHVVGPLVAQRDLGSFVGTESDAPAGSEGWPAGEPSAARPRIIVFSNRGGEEYVRVLRHLAERHPDTDVVFVGYDDPSIVTSMSTELATSRWRFHTKLTQREYFAYMEGAAAADDALLISKAGPNTTLEAAYFGIPVLMLRSGLPMERWVAGLIEQRRLGHCYTDIDELIPTLDGWLADRRTLREHRDACRTFAVTFLDQEATIDRIDQVVRTLFDRRSVTTSVGRPEGADR